MIGLAILGSFVGRPANLGVTPSTPALSPTVSNEAEKIVEAAPVLHEAENNARIEDDAAGGMKTAKKVVRRAEEAKRATRTPLTIEEKAAVARGIRELEGAAIRAESQDSRR